MDLDGGWDADRGDQWGGARRASLAVKDMAKHREGSARSVERERSEYVVRRKNQLADTD